MFTSAIDWTEFSDKSNVETIGVNKPLRGDITFYVSVIYRQNKKRGEGAGQMARTNPLNAVRRRRKTQKDVGICLACLSTGLMDFLFRRAREVPNISSLQR